jgi:battenin
MTGYTGVVLLCNIIPSLIIKLTAPFFMHLIPYNLRVISIALFAILSFQIVAWFRSVWVKMIGVCVGSLSSGIGEITFLAMSSFYHRNTISAWSSGTGAAGIVGSFSYLLLRSWMNLTEFQTLLVVTPLPLLILLSVFLLMSGDHARNGFLSRGNSNSNSKKRKMDDLEETNESYGDITFMDRIQHLIPLLKYMVPLFVVYYSEYLINQSVAPNLKFKTGIITKDNYVYYANMYQLGVFISRSSVNIFPIKRIWIPAVLQVVNFILLYLDAYYRVIPAIWFIFMIIFWEGLLGGSTYVNAFYRISCDVDERYKEFSLGVTSVADAIGICMSGLTSVWLEPYIRRNNSHRYI